MSTILYVLAYRISCISSLLIICIHEYRPGVFLVTASLAVSEAVGSAVANSSGPLPPGPLALIASLSIHLYLTNKSTSY
jgi:hypothetical protein